MSINVICHAHPFSPSMREVKELAGPRKVSEILSEMVPPGVGRSIIILNGEKLTNFETIVTDGDHIVIKILPAGGGSTEVGQAADKAGVFGAALVVAGLVTSFFIPPLGFGIAAAGGAMLLVGGVTSLSINAALNAEKNASKTPEAIPSIRGGRNQAAQWGKVPIIFGKHLVVPLYAAKSYTEIGGTDGKDMYLTQLFCLGYGPLKVSNIKLGENLLASNVAAVRNGAIADDGSFAFTGLQVYQDGTSPSLYPEIVLEDSLNIELKQTIAPDTLWRATAPKTTKVSIDITFPRGIFIFSEKGERVSNGCAVQVKRRVFGSGTAWAAATLVNTFSITPKNDTQTLRYNFTETVTSGQYEYAVTRFTPDESSDRAVSTVYWTAMRSIRAGVPPVDASVRSRFVFLALKVKASGTLQGVIDQLNCTVESEVAAYDGTGTGSAEWVLGFSQNPAAAFLRALRGPMNPRPISDSLIDWPKLEAWYTTCATKGWTCNAVVSGSSRLRDVLNQIAQTGRASLLVRDGKYSVAVDEAKTAIVQQYSPRNSWNFQWSKAFKDLAHGLKVSIISATDGYTPNERIVLADGYKYDTDGDGVLRDWNGVDRTADGAYTAATRFESIDLWGVSDPDLALKHGRYRLACDSLRQEFYTFDSDPEGLICEPGDLFQLSHDAMVVGLSSGRVKSVTLNGSSQATSMTVDELCLFDVAKSYAVRFRRSLDGVVVYATLTNPGTGETSTLSFASPVSAATVPAIGDLFTFGEATIETMPCIVAGVDVLDDLSVRIYAVDYAAGVHTADTGTIPAYVSRVSRNNAGDIGTVIPSIIQQEAQQATQVTVTGVPATTYLPVNKGNLASDPPGSPTPHHPHDTYFNTVSQTLKVYIDDGVSPAGFYDATTEIFTEAQIDTRVNVKAPRYLGRYLYASKPISANEGDTVTLYSTTAGERGIYLWVTSAWVKQTTPTTEMIANAWADICWIVNQVTDYGESLAYTGSGVDFIDVLGANIAFINKLFAQYVKIQVGGSIRGGDRYDETGATIDSTVPGFFIAASGACKVAGLEFEGSQGGGVQFGAAVIIGTKTIKTFGASAAVAVLDQNRVITASDSSFGDGYLREYTWNGSALQDFGSLLVSGMRYPQLCTLGQNQFVLYDNNAGTLQVYIYDPLLASIAVTGNALSITGSADSALCQISGSQFLYAYLSAGSVYIKCFSFDGTDISLEATSAAIATSMNAVTGLAQLSGTKFTVSYTSATPESFSQMVSYVGGVFAEVGSEFEHAITTAKTTSALNGSDLVVGNQVDGGLEIIRFNGATWDLVDSSQNYGLETDYFRICALNGTDIVIVSSDYIYIVRFSFALSIPYKVW